MDPQVIIFYFFAVVLIGAGIGVVTARNPVHSVLFLILAFFNAAALFVLIGAEYLAMTLVIVYVGAVAVLFLFVVMMLDINFTELRQGFVRHLPVALGIGVLLLAQLVVLLSRAVGSVASVQTAETTTSPMSNTEAIGRVLYTDYVVPFQAAGLILLVAMIGAIVLTLRHRKGVLRQDIAKQVGRTRADSIEIISVPTGKGIG